MIKKIDTIKAIYKLSKLLETHSTICSFTKPFALVFKLYALEEFPSKEKYVGAIHSLLTLDLRMQQLVQTSDAVGIRHEISIVLETIDGYFSDFAVASDVESSDGDEGKQEPSPSS